MSCESIVHKREGLARPCSATDLFTVTGGLQCGNCLAHNVPPGPPRCIDFASDGPCPLPREKPSGRRWIHEIAPCPDAPEVRP